MTVRTFTHARLCVLAQAYGTGGQLPPPPIRAVCRHEFGQRVDIIRAKHNTCLNNTNLGSVTAGNGKNSGTPQNIDPGKFLLLPPPPLNMDTGKYLLLPPPLNPFGQNSVCPPKWMLARTPMCTSMHSYVCVWCACGPACVCVGVRACVCGCGGVRACVCVHIKHI